MDEPIFNVVGDKVALGPFRRELIPLYVRWFNDFEATLPYLLQVGPRTREAYEEVFARVAKDAPETVDFTIYERSTSRPIGTSNLDAINHSQRRAEFNIFIGERECWGKGYGTETTILMLDYGFTLLGLHTIMLQVDGYNERAIRAYRRAGFKETGRWREACRIGGRIYDRVFMDCLATEFESPLLARLLPPDFSPSTLPDDKRSANA